MARVRIGPLSYGPRGRRGVRLGPVSASYNTRSPVFGAFMLVVIVWALIRAFWIYMLAALVILFVLRLVAIAHNEKTAAERAKRQAAEVRRWLQAPAPPLMLPSRFSDKWFAANVPRLHPGQVGPFLAEMRARGWTDQRIAQRVDPFLQQNPFLSGPAERAGR